MAWNQPTINSENQNQKSEIEKMPICVKIARFWFGLWSVGGLLLCISSYLFPMQCDYNPWTVGVGHFTWSIVTANCAVMISRRNMIGAAFAIFVQLIFGFVSFDPIVSIVIAGIPLLFLLLPKSLRWLKGNSHFSKIGAIVYISIVGVGVICSRAPLVTEKYIANVNPIRCIIVGGIRIDQTSEAHVYDYWQNGVLMGNCMVRYNQGWCCGMMLNFSNPSPGKDSAFYNHILKELKDECERTYYKVKWTVSEDNIGFPTLEGKTLGREVIEIFCPNNDDVLCSLFVYVPQLLDQIQDKPAASKVPPKPRYGEGLPDTYGGNKHLFYRTGYARGLVDDEVEDAHKQDKPAESKEPQIVGARLGPSRHSESVKAQHAARAKAEQQAIAARNARNAGKTGFDNYDDLSDSQRRRRDQALEDRKAKFFESTGYGRP